MLQRLLGIAAALSILLIIAAAVLWALEPTGTKLSFSLLRRNLDEWLCLCVGIGMFLGLAWIAAGMLRTAVRNRGRSKETLVCDCGYELTGNVSGICPECGKAFGSKAIPTKDPRTLDG